MSLKQYLLVALVIASILTHECVANDGKYSSFYALNVTVFYYIRYYSIIYTIRTKPLRYTSDGNKNWIAVRNVIDYVNILRHVADYVNILRLLNQFHLD